MLNTANVHTTRRDRLIKGVDNWWFLGPGGIAKVRPQHLDSDGDQLPLAQAQLRAAGLYEVQAHSVYTLTVLTSTDCNLGCAYCWGCRRCGIQSCRRHGVGCGGGSQHGDRTAAVP
jgi:hypothetical protein